MSRAYRRLRAQVFTQGEHTLRTVQDEHIEPIRRFRNAQLDVLRQAKPLTADDQRAYYERVIWPSMELPEPAQLIFAIEHRGAFVGYGGLVHVSWPDARAEVSFLLDPALAADPAAYERHFRAYLSLIRQVAFDDLGLHRLFTETFDVRPQHVAILESSGYVREGVLRDHARVGERFVDSLIHGCLHAPR